MKKPEDQLVPAAPKLSLPQDVPPSLKRQGAMYAPVTNYFQGPDAAAGKLVDMRLQRSGATPPSAIGPPAPAAPTFLQRAAPNVAAASQSILQQTPTTLMGRLGQSARMTTEAIKLPFEAAGTALNKGGAVVSGAAREFGAGFTGQPSPAAAPAVSTSAAPAVAAPAATPGVAPQASGAIRSPLDRPGFVPTPAAAPAPVVDTTMLGPLKRAQAPGEVGRSVSGRALPGAPQVGADGSIVYDQAFMDRNPGLAKEYAQVVTGPLSVSSVGPGVAASMVTGGNMPSGPLTRRPDGFTASDRAAQLDALDRLGRSNAETKIRQALGKAAKAGDAEAVAQLAGAVGTLASPPLEPMRRGMAESAARLGMDQSRLAMDQGKAQADAEAQGVDTRARALQLKQAEQMQALTQQLMQGTPEEKQAAAQSLAALQGTKPGQPISIERQVPMGTDRMGTVQFKKETGLYDPSTGQERWFTAGSKKIPQGMTEQSVLAEAQASIAAGKDPAAVAAMLSEYGLTLPN